MVNSGLWRHSIAYSSLEEIEEAAKKVIEFAQKVKFWVFEGDMGAGKTTLIKAICKQLEVEDTVSSPTYSIVNEYNTRRGHTIYHFDFYRIKDESEAYDIGAEEYFDSGNYCFVEWPSRVSGLLPTNNFLNVSIILAADGGRLIELTRHD